MAIISIVKSLATNLDFKFQISNFPIQTTTYIRLLPCSSSQLIDERHRHANHCLNLNSSSIKPRMVERAFSVDLKTRLFGWLKPIWQCCFKRLHRMLLCIWNPFSKTANSRKRQLVRITYKFERNYYWVVFGLSHLQTQSRQASWGQRFYSVDFNARPVFGSTWTSNCSSSAT